MDIEDFKYDPVSGKFYNKSGKEIGSYTRKYGRFFFKGKEIKLHRLAVYLMLGEWPTDEVDHIDGNPHNNCWDNLRTCTRRDNAKNRKRYKNSTTGCKGVYLYQYKDTVRYCASI